MLNASECITSAIMATAFFSAGAVIAADKTWTVEALMNLKGLSDPQITSDGTKIAYLVTTANIEGNVYDSEIWVSTTAANKAYRLVSAPYRPSQQRWSSEGRRLAFLSGRDGIAQVYVADTSDKRPIRLTDSPANVTYFKWSPDGKQLAYLTTDPPTIDEVAKVRRGDDAIVAHQGHKYSRIYILPSQGGKSCLVTQADRHVTSFDWASDGSRIVYAGQDTPRYRHIFHVDLFEIDLSSGREQPLVVQIGQDTAPAYSRDARRVAFYSQHGKLNYFGERQVGLADVRDGRIRYVTDQLFEGDVFAGGKRFWWSPDNSELMFGAGKGTHNYLYSTRMNSDAPKPLLDSLTDPSDFSANQDGRRIAFIKSSVSAPPELYFGERAGSEIKESRLSNLNPQVPEYPLVKSQTMRWKSKDGFSIEGVMTLPVAYKQGNRVPLIVYLHGTTGVALERFQVSPAVPTQLFAQEGFAVLEPNFRGSINYGAEFRLAALQTQGFADVDDIMTGIDMLVEQGVADGSRLGVMGWSYGGYLGAWIIGHSHRFKAASIGASTTDWITWYGGYYGGMDAPPEMMWDFFGGKPWDLWEVYNRHSPRYYLKNAKTPSLLLHGEHDVDSSPEIFQALTDLNVPVEFVTYPREGHGIEEPMHQRDVMSRIVQWFKRWIPGG